jgi:hypothetical protein
MKRLINAIGFQAGWWAIIVGVGHGFELQAMALCLSLVGLHIYFASDRQRELHIAVIAWLLGVLIDSLLQYFSIIHFYGWALWQLSPFWLWMLWVLFAMTLNASLAWLQTQALWLSALLGGVAGPLTYLAGARFGAAFVQPSVGHVLVLALTWALALPILVAVARKSP